MKDKKDSSLTCILNFIRSNIAVLSIISSLILICLGWVIFGVSPLNTFEEIAYKQEQNNLKKNFTQFHNELGDYFLDIGQVDAAKYEFKQVVEVDPLNQTARFSLFKCDVFEPISNKTGYDPEISRKRLEMILNESKDTDPHAYLFLGDLYLLTDQEEALKNYQKAVDLDNSVVAAYAQMGFIYDQQNKHEKSIEMYEKALNVSKWNLAYLNNLAYQYCVIKEYQKAIEKYRLLLSLDSSYLLSYNTISNSYRLTGNLESALDYQKLLITLLGNRDITDLDKNQRSWCFHVKSGRTVYLYSDSQKKIYSYYNLALTYYLLGNENEAIECLKKINESDIDNGSELDVKEIVAFDIDNLQEEQTSFLNRSEEFRKRFLA